MFDLRLNLAVLLFLSAIVSPAVAQTTRIADPGPSDGKASAMSPEQLRARDMKNCLDAWDSFAQMTREEWRRTCERTINMREYKPLDELKPQ